MIPDLKYMLEIFFIKIVILITVIIIEEWTITH
jgi:hypothetical protein